MNDSQSGGLLQAFKAASGSLLDFFYPPRCPVCGAYVEARGAWCPDCLARTCCPQRLPLKAEQLRYMNAAYALAAYRGGLRDILRALKFHRRRSVLPYISTVLAAAAREELISGLLHDLAAGQAIAVPVPLHRSREHERGYNQTELIFRAWLASHGIELVCVLQRTRRTKPMYRLSAAERRANIKGAFAIADAVAPQLSSRPILLVDDIFTTGATLTECARVLRQAGAGSVSVLVLASDHR